MLANVSVVNESNPQDILVVRVLLRSQASLNRVRKVRKLPLQATLNPLYKLWKSVKVLPIIGLGCWWLVGCEISAIAVLTAMLGFFSNLGTRIVLELKSKRV